MVIRKRKDPYFVARCNNESALRALSPAREPAPAVLANSAPFSAALSSAMGGKAPNTEPLSPIAPAIKFLDNGEAICALTEMEPADSPAMVILLGSPPKAGILCFNKPIAPD